ncbi:MAG: right-handed parallel beta-helix repeat-containing protein [Candidatus Helarchaeota archaeon]|nr:right-handed parallel beta-helix repeat-containing protein [Candidatus Helarchaeota archaeon]
MKRIQKVLPVLMILVLIGVGCVKITQPETSIRVLEPKIELTVKWDPPISINNNTQLANAASAGNGTASNPYIIENYWINASGTGNPGIEILNTDAYFILRYCAVFNSDSPLYAGIRIQGCDNGQILNNTVMNSLYGFYVAGSNNVVANNTAFYNNYDGFFIGGTGSWTNVTHNNASYNGLIIGSGFYFTGQNIHVTNNVAISNTDDGFLVDISQGLVLEKNTAISNNDNGIELFSSSWMNIFRDNILDGNGDSGIFFEPDNGNQYNNFIHNLITSNNQYGIYILSGPPPQGPKNNFFYHNLLWGNSPDHLFDTSQPSDNNTFSENIWGLPDADRDLDGLLNKDEVPSGTDAFDPDTDDDGLPDGWEVDNSLYPTNSADGLADPDLDQVLNLYEYRNGTDPHDPDTDDDSMPDGYEITYSLNPTSDIDNGTDLDGDGLPNLQEFYNGINPRNNDTDADGLTDGEEVRDYETDPSKWDTDDDLLPDRWEVTNFLSPLNHLDAYVDLDVDGLSNIQEYLLNTSIYNYDSDADGYSDGVEVAAGTDPLDEYDFPSPPAPEPESILLELSILIGCTAIAVAIVVYGLLQRSRPMAPPPPSPPKQAPPDPKKPVKD